jgi:sodium/potassium/calcium exchanger 6
MDIFDCNYENVANSLDRCQFVKTNCAGSGLVNLWYLNYCLFSQNLWITISLATAVTFICFNLLQTTADMYLTPLLKKIADDLKLPETVAGVTL